MGLLKAQVGEGIAILALLIIVLLYKNHDPSASPNLFISHLHTYKLRISSEFDTGIDSHRQSPAVRNITLRISSEFDTGTDSHRQSPVVRNITQPRVALCLVGGARAFELTAESILRHLINPHDKDWDPDVFLHAPLDSDAHKFTLLENISPARLASARIFVPELLPESVLYQELLYGGTSPNGIQGLLQYFHLVEGCLDMIDQHEKRHGFRYDWVARTRVDGFWTGPVPPLSSLNASNYYIPIGSQFGGLNDRFGLGNRNATVAALSRLSLLPFLHERGLRKLNSESAFRAQLEELQIPSETIAVPFCILSRRKYRWPLERAEDVPVASIGTVGPLNGAKCRPCTPAATGPEAEQAASKLAKQWGWPGHVRGLALCDGSGDWEENWEDVYAEAAGRKFENQRKRVLSRTREECEADFLRFEEQWEAWDAPPAEQICSRQYSR
ncbi:hypothetical protein M758_11G117100 [Ceratodon purpureus]|nr:hypothetical protein M758_11G117100 [Ceratodon purpureus]